MDSEYIISTILNLRKDELEKFDITFSEDKTIMYLNVTLKRTIYRCPYCGTKVNILNYTTHNYKHLDIFKKKSVIVWRRRRYRCANCAKTFSEDNPFGLNSLNVSYATIQTIMDDILEPLSIKYIANKNHVSKTLIETYIDSFLIFPRIRLAKNIGIDEIHSSMAKYGGAYLAVIIDNDTNNLIEILPNRSKVTLKRYFENIPKEELDEVSYVTMDMWEPYRDIALKYFRNAKIAVDPFHVIEHLTKGFDKLRIKIMNEQIYGSHTYYLLKHWNWLLSKDVELDNKPEYNKHFGYKLNFRDIYNMLLQIDDDLTKAYHLKENYRALIKYGDISNAEEWFDILYEEFKNCGLSCYEEFTEMIFRWRPYIINSFIRTGPKNKKLTNATTEHMNEELGLLIRISKGLNNFERFRVRAIDMNNSEINYIIKSKLSTNKIKGKKRGSYNKND